MAGRRGSAIGRRKKTAFSGGYVSLGRRISLQIFALELYMLFGLSELSHKKIKFQLLFSKMPQRANWRSHIMLAGNLDKYPIP